MKICVISNLFRPYCRGGAENIVDITINELKKKNKIILISTQPKKESVSIENEVKIYRFRPKNIFYYLNDYKHFMPTRLLWHFFDLFNVFSAYRVKKILLQEKPDLVIIHNLKGLGYLISRVVNKLKIKNIQILHDVQYAVPSGLIIKGEENGFLVNGFLTKIYQKICQRLIVSPTIIAPSKWLAKYYLNLGYFQNKEVCVIRNPIKENKIVMNQEKKLTNNLLFLGQIEKHKGIVFLLEILKNLPKVNLLIAGQGSLLEKLKMKYKNFENIKFLGQIEQAKLLEIFGQVSYLVMPTLCYENSPTVIYESFSFSTPVIVSDIGGAGELVKDSGAGFLFEPANPQSLKVAIENALNNQNYSQMCILAQQYIKQFEVHNYTKKLLK